MQRLDLFPNNELISQYRQVFSSGAGLTVLSHILYDLGTFLEVSAGPEDIALKNYGNRLLKILSGGEIAEDNLKAFTKQLMKQPLPKERNKGDE